MLIDNEIIAKSEVSGGAQITRHGQPILELQQRFKPCISATRF